MKKKYIPIALLFVVYQTQGMFLTNSLKTPYRNKTFIIQSKDKKKEGKWHLLAPEMVTSVANDLDFYSCDQLRQSCKNYHKIINHEYYKTKLEFTMLPHIAQRMNTNAYTRNMIFFANSNASQATNLYSATSYHNQHTTNRIEFLVKSAIGKECFSRDPQVYKQKYFGTIIRILNAWKEHRYDIFQVIVHHSGDVNFQDKNGNAAYHDFTHSDFDFPWQAININIRNNKGEAPLHCTEYKRHTQYLLQHPKIDVNIQNYKGETPLHCAITNPQSSEYSGSLHVWIEPLYMWKVAKVLLEDPRTNVYMTTDAGRTALHYAAKNSSHKEGDAEDMLFNKTTKTTGFYILKLIAEKLHQNDLCTVDLKKRTPLHLAAKYGHIEAVAFLYNKLPDDMKYAIDKDGRTPLHLAAKYDHKNVVKFLFPQYPDHVKYAPDNDGKTLLHLAAVHRGDMIEFLFPQFPDPIKYTADKDGNTLLHLATIQRCVGVLKFLCTEMSLISISPFLSTIYRLCGKEWVNENLSPRIYGK